MSTPLPAPPVLRELLAAPELRRYLDSYVRRRLPPSDADDAVQAILCAALEAKRAPSDPEEVRKWVTGIARHKIAGHFEQRRREQVGDVPEAAASPVDHEVSSLVAWAEQQATLVANDVDENAERRAEETLDWMAREGDGEKLEAIAEEAQVPAARVRQRVSRMRRWMRERWAAELAAVMAAVALATLGWWLFVRKPAETARKKPDAPAPSMSIALPTLTPRERAQQLRDRAFIECDQQRFATCLRALDEAAALDPAGDTEPRVRKARQDASRSMAPERAPDVPIAPSTSVMPPRASTPAPPPTAAPTARSTPAPRTAPMAPSHGTGTPAGTAGKSKGW